MGRTRYFMAAIAALSASAIPLAASAGASEDLDPPAEAVETESVVAEPTEQRALPDIAEAPPAPPSAAAEVEPVGPVAPLAPASPQIAVASPAAPLQAVDPNVSPQQSDCDPNYSGACVPTNIGNVTCGDVDGTNFQVIGQDIHGLDRGGIDGIACEDDSASAATGATSPDTAPPPDEVQGATATASDELAQTGGSTIMAVVAFGLLIAGMFIATGAGVLTNPLTSPLRGGFTVTSTNSRGQTVRYRVTSNRSNR